MEKLIKAQLFDAFYKFNREHKEATQFSKTSITGIIVFKSSNWAKPYSLESRSYRVSSANKAFLDCAGGSIYATNLDGTDQMIRLDYYPNWEVDYCYIEEGGKI